MKATVNDVRAAVLSARQTNEALRKGEIDVETAKALHTGDGVVARIYAADAKHREIELMSRKHHIDMPPSTVFSKE
jgi:hypothetical protein